MNAIIKVARDALRFSTHSAYGRLDSLRAVAKYTDDDESGAIIHEIIKDYPFPADSTEDIERWAERSLAKL